MRSADGGLRKILRERVPDWHWQSVETGAIGQGVPDTNYCARGQEGWVECKWTDGYVVGLEPQQVAWILRRCRAGGLVSVAVRRRCDAGPRRAAADEIYLLRGSHARLTRDAGLRPLGVLDTEEAFDAVSGALLYRGEGGPGRWDWQMIRAALLRRPDPWSDALAGG